MPTGLPGEPFSPQQAKAMVRQIIQEGAVIYSNHAQEEMLKENPPILAPDCVNLLVGGVYDPAEFENGEWRYRARTTRITVIVAFRSVSRLRVVTAWRNR